MKLFKKVKEIRSRSGELHFERFAIIETSFFALYIHTIHKHDEDRHLHSHPWNFLTVVLTGAYLALGQDGSTTVKIPGTFSRMSRHGFHKIGRILDGPVKTLFFAWGKRSPWHYLVNGEKVESAKYRKMKHEGRLPADDNLAVALTEHFRKAVDEALSQQAVHATKTESE